MKNNNSYITVEIPEFKGMDYTNVFKKFHIKGIETESPVIRLDNYIFEGKWVSDPNLFFLNSQYKSLHTERNMKSSLLLELTGVKNTFKPTKFLKRINLFNQSSIFSHKKIRLYRIPMDVSDVKMDTLLRFG